MKLITARKRIIVPTVSLSKVPIILIIFLLILTNSCQKDQEVSRGTKDLLAKNSMPKELAGTSKNLANKSITIAGPIVLNNQSNLIIRGDSINGGTQACITLNNCTNIRITNCKLVNSNSVGIYVGNSSNIRIDSNYIANVSTGVFAASSKTIQVEFNQMQNMRGPYPKGSFVQFVNVNGSYNRVEFNKLENISGSSNPKDAISMYKSNGLSTDPIYIIGNWIRGGGPGITGSGITLGVGGGSYQIASDNILVNTGYIGMQVAGGTNIQIINNSIASDPFPWSHLGISCGNYSGLPGNDITISGNKVKWLSAYPADLQYYPGNTRIEFDGSFQQGTSMPIGWNTNEFGANISPTSLLPAVIITNK